MNELDKARVELYNAAVGHAQYVMSDEVDFGRAMSVSRRLEEAASEFVRIKAIFDGTAGPG